MYQYSYQYINEISPQIKRKKSQYLNIKGFESFVNKSINRNFTEITPIICNQLTKQIFITTCEKTTNFKYE
jgi:hypothetical protein